MIHFRPSALMVTLASVLAAQSTVAEPLNTLEIVNLTENRLEIVQTPEAGHIARVTFDGSDNGAATAANLSASAWFGTLEAGTIRQTGQAQRAVLDIAGVGNLFAISQSGYGNSVLGRMTGTANIAVIQQSGIGNHAQFTQQGQGNSLSISQSM